LRHHLQCIVVAHIHAEGAALAGVGIDGDREQATATFFLLLFLRPVRFGGGKFEAADTVAQQVQFDFQACAFVTRRRVLRESFSDGVR
jgi:hypothetical protein